MVPIVILTFVLGFIIFDFIPSKHSILADRFK